MDRNRQRQLMEEVKSIKELIRQVPLATVDLNFITQLLSGHQFVDPYYPPTSYALYGSSRNTLDCRVVWLRPYECISSAAQLFSNSIEQSDIMQGKLGNCWFMSALCSLANAQAYISRLFETSSVSPFGIYRIKLCKNAEWTTVVIDDLIPCDASDQKPVFSQNNGPELWVVLLEKAYAKLHGSYMSLKGGFAADAFIDLTGLPAFSYYFDEYEAEIKSGEFWRWLENWSRRGFALTAATDSGISKHTGMVSGHYYSLIRVERVQGEQLLNLRNPWGEFEWKGAWSDYSHEWTEPLRRQYNVHFDKNDGAFWMSFQDFLQYYGRVVVGKLGFDSEYRTRALFGRDPSSGCISRYSYTIGVSARTEVIIGLHQEDDRSEGVSEYRRYLDLGIVVLKYEHGEYSFVAATSKNRTDRDQHVECVLDPGWYVVVPISGGCGLQRPPDAQPQSFPFLTEYDSLHPLFQGTIRDLFRRLDRDLNQTICQNEFIEFSSRIGHSIDAAAFYNVICNKYTSTEMGVTLQGFFEMFAVSVHDFNGEATVRQWLQQVGYDNDLYSIEERPLVFTVHSTVPIQCSKQPIDRNVSNTAWGLAAENVGKREQDCRGVNLYTIRGSSGVSFIAKNHSQSVKNFSLDMRESRNVEFGIANGRSEVELHPGTSAPVQHVQCMRSESRYNYSLSMSVR